MKNQKGFTLPALVLIIVVMFFVIGWILNIVDIVRSSFDDFTPLLILRFIGVLVAPLGSILGWFF